MKKLLYAIGRALLVSAVCIIDQGVCAQSASQKSQKTTAATKPLKPGDALPEAVWTTPLQVVNHPSKTITLDNDRDKLILIEFWASNCSGCISTIPKMIALQQEFADRVRILPVSSQDRSVLERFFAAPHGSRYNRLMSVSNDKLFGTLFPYMAVPHVIWIHKGKMLTSTDAEQVTAETINEILGGKESGLQEVVQLDKNKPLLLSERFESMDQRLRYYSIFTEGYNRSIGSGGALRTTDDGTVNGRLFSNLPLWDIYYAIGYRLFPQLSGGEKINGKRVITEVRDLESLRPNVENEEVYRKNSYSYDLIVPAESAGSLYAYMLEDLNRYLPYRVSFEERTTPCLVLVRTSRKDKLATKGGKKTITFPRSPSILQNAPLGSMVNMINGNTPIKLPIIDETGYEGNADVKISGVKDLATLRKELARYDLDLIETERPLLMMVIRDKQVQSKNQTKPQQAVGTLP